MTDREKQEFIDKVKGKKIRHSVYCEGDYFIPDGEWDNNIFYGSFYINYELITKDIANAYFINGFKPDKDGDYWEIIEDDEISTIKSCQHDWKNYHGFTESYQYCEKCGVKKG